MQIDETNQRIIALLVADARASYADIGAEVSLSAPAVKRRVDRLRAAKVIRGYTAIIDPAALGWTTEAFVELFCTGRTTPLQIAAAAQSTGDPEPDDDDEHQDAEHRPAVAGPEPVHRESECHHAGHRSPPLCRSYDVERCITPFHVIRRVATAQ